MRLSLPTCLYISNLHLFFEPPPPPPCHHRSVEPSSHFSMLHFFAPPPAPQNGVAASPIKKKFPTCWKSHTNYIYQIQIGRPVKKVRRLETKSWGERSREQCSHLQKPISTFDSNTMGCRWVSAFTRMHCDWTWLLTTRKQVKLSQQKEFKKMRTPG